MRDLIVRSAGWTGGAVLAAGLAVLVLMGVPVDPAWAEPVLDRALADVQMIPSARCVFLRIEFNFRVQYAGHVPTDRGRSLTIRVRALDRAMAGALTKIRREALRPLSTPIGHVSSIEFEASGAAGPALRLEFDRILSVDAGPGRDATSIVVSLARNGQPACRPEFPADGWSASVSRPEPDAGAGRTGRGTAKPIVARGTGTPTRKQVRRAGAWLDEARAAMRGGRHRDAIVKLRKLLALPENEFSQEAQERLGSAYKKTGDLASAAAQFTDYLSRYPKGPDAERIRQRLRGVSTARGTAVPRRRAAKRRRYRGPESGSEWIVSGSWSQFYVRDDSFRKLRDPSLPPKANPDPDEHETNRDALLSSFVMTARWINSFAKSTLRFSGTEKHDFTGRKSDRLDVASLYYDTEIFPWDLNLRAGRQTGNTNGVFGRFDGGALVWRPKETVRLGIVGGSPVARRHHVPYEEEKVFYGVNAGYTFENGLDVGVYGIEQRAHSLVDRRAIGTDIRYLGTDVTVFSTLDYDIFYEEFNLALFSATWKLPDQLVVHGSAEHRKSPFLTTWNALQGQLFPTLYDMLKARTKEEIYAAASDRTASYNSANIGFSRPVAKDVQVAFDATWVNVEGTVPSYGVPGTDGTGNEFYYSAHLLMNNLITEGDTSIAALRYADRRDTDLWVIDLQTRYPVSTKFWVRPRLRLAYLEGKRIDLTEYTVQPSLLVDYAIDRRLHLEFEVGANWSDRQSGTLDERSTDLFFTIGYRYDFDFDGKSRCRLPGFYCNDLTPNP